MAGRGKTTGSKSTQFKPGNPGGVINETTRARRAYRAAFDVLLATDEPYAHAIRLNPKDSPARRLAKLTLKDAVSGNKHSKSAARRMIMDLFANRPAQGVYVSDEDGNAKDLPEDPSAIAARLVGLGVTLPKELVPRPHQENAP